MHCKAVDAVRRAGIGGVDFWRIRHNSDFHSLDIVEYGYVFFNDGFINGDGQPNDWLADGAAGQGGNGIGLDMGRAFI